LSAALARSVRVSTRSACALVALACVTAAPAGGAWAKKAAIASAKSPWLALTLSR
jgi:hypothetical protein